MRLPHAQPAADGGPFQLVLDPRHGRRGQGRRPHRRRRQQRLFAEVERLGLDSEAKAFVFDLLSQPVDLASITGRGGDAGAGRRGVSRLAPRHRLRMLPARTRLSRCAGARGSNCPPELRAQPRRAGAAASVRLNQPAQLCATPPTRSSPGTCARSERARQRAVRRHSWCASSPELHGVAGAGDAAHQLTHANRLHQRLPLAERVLLSTA